MFLGTPKSWWVVIGICFVLGLALAASGVAGTPGVVIGVILVFGAIIAFAGAPMRYGDRARQATERKPTPAASSSAAPPPPPRPRARIEARDASDV
jgi:hypothetical protein